MLTEEQLEMRRSGIGGSDMAAVLGMSPYQQAIDVFYDKRPDLAKEHGWVPDVVEGDQIDFGNYVEEPIAQLYTKTTGLKVRKSNIHHTHPKANWLKANIDRKVEGIKRGLEIKSINWRLAHLWGESGTDQVAEYYLPQIFHYMVTLDYPEWDAAALIGGATDFRIYHLQRDAEWDDIILDAANDFWNNHVVPGIPPAIDLHHKKARQVLKKVYHQVDGDEITLPDSAIHWHQAKEEAKAKIKAYQGVVDAAELHLMELAGDAAKIRIPGVKGAYVREKQKRKGFTVEPTEYIQMRYSSRFK